MSHHSRSRSDYPILQISDREWSQGNLEKIFNECDELITKYGQDGFKVERPEYLRWIFKVIHCY